MVTPNSTTPPPPPLFPCTITSNSPLHPLHRFLHLLDPSRPASSGRLQAPPQTPPQMDHAHPIRLSRLPPHRRLLAVTPLSHLSLPLPAPKTRLRRSLHLHQHLDHLHPRRRVRGQFTHHQRRRLPLDAPSLLQLQLRPIHHLVGSIGGSYRKPNEELFRRETKMGKEEWERQTREMERMVKEVEGEDERLYGEGDSGLQRKKML